MSENKSLNPFTALYLALVMPDKSFQKEEQFSASRILLLALILILIMAGSLLSTQFHLNPTMKSLTIEETNRRFDNMMAHATEEEKEQAKQRAHKTMQGNNFSVLQVVGIVLGSAVWLLYILEFWFLFIILAQFFGGEETPIYEKKHRRTQYLAIYGAIPLACQELVRGVVLYLKDPSAIGNVLTLSEYSEATEVSFSLLSVFSFPKMFKLFEYILFNLTNPFYLWALFIFLFGGSAILKITKPKMCGILGIIVLVLGLQHTLFSMIGGFIGA